MKVVTYNIRHAQGLDGLISPKRVARTLDALGADVIGLQEVWCVPRRTDQTAAIAGQLGMDSAYSVAATRGPLQLGNSVVARGRILDSRDFEIPHRQERRTCLVARVESAGLQFNFAVTHMTLHRATRAEAIEHLARTLPRDLPLVLVGDFNGTSAELEPLTEMLTVPAKPPATFPSVGTRSAIDHIAFSEHFALKSLQTARSWASDHLPLIAELELNV